MKAIQFSICVFLFVNTAKAQVNYSDFITSGEYDSYYKVAVRERQAVPLVSLQEANVKYYHRVIRCIDSRQKMNKAIDWPRNPLSSILYTALWEGKLVAYKNDSLSSAYTTTQFQNRMGYEQNVQISINPNDPTDVTDTTYWVPIGPDKIKKFMIMEDWIFDAELSVFKPRIIAIAPIFRPEFAVAGLVAPEQPACWIMMDDNLRNYLSQQEMFNRYNQAARMSYDDFFQMRTFDSYIVYESNLYDSYINQMEEFENDPIGALLESDRIKNDLFIFEHDLWQF